MSIKTILKFILKSLLILTVTPVVIILAINFFIVFKASNNIISENNYDVANESDCILILGCAVNPDKTPSNMLADRLDTGINLYNNNLSSKILMSGDHRTDYYNEVLVMKNYATDRNIPAYDIFMDHLGLSTYESIYRAKHIFQAKKIIIVTQRYHLYRALYIAEQMGLEAYGVVSDLRNYSEPFHRHFREILARNKDFINLIINKDNYYGGKTIPISGDGRITEEKLQ